MRPRDDIIWKGLAGVIAVYPAAIASASHEIGAQGTGVGIAPSGGYAPLSVDKLWLGVSMGLAKVSHPWGRFESWHWTKKGSPHQRCWLSRVLFLGVPVLGLVSVETRSPAAACLSAKDVLGKSLAVPVSSAFHLW